MSSKERAALRAKGIAADKAATEKALAAQERATAEFAATQAATEAKAAADRAAFAAEKVEAERAAAERTRAIIVYGLGGIGVAALLAFLKSNGRLGLNPEPPVIVLPFGGPDRD